MLRPLVALILAILLLNLYPLQLKEPNRKERKLRIRGGGGLKGQMIKIADGCQLTGRHEMDHRLQFLPSSHNGCVYGMNSGKEL